MLLSSWYRKAFWRGLILAFLILPVISYSWGKAEWDWPLKIGIVTLSNKPISDFKKITEFVNNHENTARRIIVRTNPDNRAGLYFETSLNHTAETFPENTIIELYYISTQTPETQLRTFILPKVNAWELLLGLTGPLEPCEKQCILAWKIAIKNPEGVILAEKKSFLWE